MIMTSRRSTLLDRLIPLYEELLGQLADAGAEWVQLDEPIVVTDLEPAELDAAHGTYRTLARSEHRPKLHHRLLLRPARRRARRCSPRPRSRALAVDLVGAGAASLDDLAGQPALAGKRLIAGVVSGRNVWRTDLAAALGTLGTLLGLGRPARRRRVVVRCCTSRSMSPTSRT